MRASCGRSRSRLIERCAFRVGARLLWGVWLSSQNISRVVRAFGVSRRITVWRVRCRRIPVWCARCRRNTSVVCWGIRGNMLNDIGRAAMRLDWGRMLGLWTGPRGWCITHFDRTLLLTVGRQTSGSQGECRLWAMKLIKQSPTRVTFHYARSTSNLGRSSGGNDRRKTFSKRCYVTLAFGSNLSFPNPNPSEVSFPYESA
jgi:hypothetical protein